MENEKEFLHDEVARLQELNGILERRLLQIEAAYNSSTDREAADYYRDRFEMTHTALEHVSNYMFDRLYIGLAWGFIAGVLVAYTLNKVLVWHS